MKGRRPPPNQLSFLERLFGRGRLDDAAEAADKHEHQEPAGTAGEATGDP